MNKVKTWHIFVAILMVVLVFFVVRVAFGDEGNQKLSREEQIQIMIKCIGDANLTLAQAKQTKYITFKGKSRSVHAMDWGSYQLRASVAHAFFQYRTKDR